MKKKAFLFVLCLFALAPLANAATDYLWAYAPWVSNGAYQSALAYTPPVALTEEELSIFRLGYACGYDTAKGADDFAFIAEEEDDNAFGTRAFAAQDDEEPEERYIINAESNKFHKPGCSAEKKILPEHRREVIGTFDAIRNMGYSPCGICLKSNGM